MSTKNAAHPSEEDLSAFIDGMMDLPAMQSVGAHLDACAACRAIRDGFRENKGRLRALAVTPPESAAFWERAFDHLETGAALPNAESRSAPSFQTRRPAFRSRWSYAAAAAVLIMAAVAVRGPVAGLLKPRATQPTAISVPAEEDAVDLAQLVWAHTSAASQQPLADPERQAMLAVENDSLRSEADIVAEETL
jgi:predicted anti-sigma-YlaC factor YlaD